MFFSFLLISGHTSLSFLTVKQAKLCIQIYIRCVCAVQSIKCNNSHAFEILSLFRHLFGTKRNQCCSFCFVSSFSPPFSFSSPLLSPCYLLSGFLSSPPPRLLSARVSRVCAFFICCPTWLRTSQASHPIGPLVLPGMKPY